MSSKNEKRVPREVVSVCVDAAKLTGLKIGQYQRLLSMNPTDDVKEILEGRICDTMRDFTNNIEFIFGKCSDGSNRILEQVDFHADSALRWGVDIAL